LGSDNFSQMSEFYKEEGEVIIQGFISMPNAVKTNRSQQYLFVNNRPVYNNIIHKAIYNAYRNLIPSGSHPMFVIKLELEPEMIDVNVHPRKMEVKFLRQQDIFRIVENAVRDALSKKQNSCFFEKGANASSTPKYSAFQEKSFNHNIPFRLPKYNKDSIGQNQINKAIEFNKEIFLTSNNYAENKKEEAHYKILGQVNKLYLVVEQDKGILIIDQHAAHERILFDKFKDNFDSAHSQQLLAPLNLEFSLGEMQALKDNLQFLNKIGFEIEEFSANTASIQSIPQDIANRDLRDIIKGLISDFISDSKKDLISNEKTLEEKRDKAISYMACRGAVKAGDSLSYEEQNNLVQKVISGEVKSTCPHGRPIAWFLSWEEIGKQFKRI